MMVILEHLKGLLAKKPLSFGDHWVGIKQTFEMSVLLRIS